MTAPPPAADDTPRHGLWTLNPFTRSLSKQSRLWQSWQAAISAFLVLTGALQLSSAVLRAHHVRPLGWVVLAFFTAGAVWTIVAWISLYRARDEQTPTHQRP